MKTYKPVIYIVEDDPFFNKHVTSYLSSKNFGEIYSFLSGEDCIEKINIKKPDVVLMDYLLPMGNGIEVMQNIKRKYIDIEFIFISGQTDIKVAVNALKEGAFDYIVKDIYATENALNKIFQILRLKKLEKIINFNKVYTRILLGALIISWALLLLNYFLIK